MNEPRTYPEGVTCWVDIEAADVEVAARFYGALFGWTFIDSPPGRRAATSLLNSTARIPRESVNRLSRTVRQRPRDLEHLHRRPGHRPGRCPRSSSRRPSHGATFERRRGRPNCILRGHGRRTVPFVAGREAAGAQMANTPGAWNFSDLHTADPAASVAFYTRVFGWVFDDLGFATMIRQPGYGDHLAATSDPGSTRDSPAIRCRPVSPMPSVGWLRRRTGNNRTGM